jgi:hypothetical protein
LVTGPKNDIGATMGRRGGDALIGRVGRGVGKTPQREFSMNLSYTCIKFAGRGREMADID